MKYVLLLALVSFSSPAFARDYFEEMDRSLCSGMRVVSDSKVTCWGARNAKQILGARFSKNDQVTLDDASDKIFPDNFQINDVVTLGIWPDDSTSSMYDYIYLLRDSERKIVGYFVISGYVNYEMELKIQTSARYNKYGEMVSIKVDNEW